MVSISFWRLEAAAALVSQLLKFEMKTDSAFGAPGRTPRELARSGSWALLHPQSKAELAQGEYKGQRSKGGTGTTRTHRRAAGWPGGVLRT
jgi:hypothetical protein